jgi:hypothetical protein
MPEHSQQEMIPLYLYGELTESERRQFEQHVIDCEQCRKELEATRRLHTFLSAVPAPTIADALLQQSRMQADSAVRALRATPSVGRRIKELFSFPLVHRPVLALCAIALVMVGFLAGRFIPSFGRDVSNAAETELFADIAVTAGGEVKVTNVQFVGGTTGGEIDVLYDVVRPVRVHGSLDSPAMQKALAYAVVKGENPGVRLRAVGSITATNLAPPEPEVKAALLLALNSDPNDGVRKEALTALLRYRPDRSVRDALLQVLLHDTNPGLRVAAINGLDSLRARGYQPDEALPESYRQQLQKDDNMYVRVKSRSLIEGTLQ